MRKITKFLINEFKIKELGYDFLGFSLQKGNTLSFHHLILSKEYCRKNGLGKGFWDWNGVILCQETSHEYLHLIQRVEPKYFGYLTCEMIDMKMKGYLDTINLKRIGEILDTFEEKHITEQTDKGYYLIKEKYLDRNRFK